MPSIVFIAGYVTGISFVVGIGITIAYFINKKLSGKKTIQTQS